MVKTYSRAVQNLFSNRYKKKANTQFDVLKQKPNGWIYIPSRKNRLVTPQNNNTFVYYDNRSAAELEYVAYKKEKERITTLASTFEQRFLSALELDLMRQDYSPEEIYNYIENLMYNDDEEDDDGYNPDDCSDDSDGSYDDYCY
tara:strand:- start:158 stop:589 length:432 start_codon:yes stop_codon:yes gene_type:complete